MHVLYVTNRIVIFVCVVFVLVENWMIFAATKNVPQLGLFFYFVLRVLRLNSCLWHSCFHLVRPWYFHLSVPIKVDPASERSLSIG